MRPPRSANKVLLAAASAAGLLLVAGIAGGCGSTKKAQSKGDVAIAYAKVIPGDKVLQKRGLTTVRVKPGTRFVVGVENKTAQPERDVQVELTLDQKPASVVLKKTIDRLGSSADAVFSPAKSITEYALPVSVKVDVVPVAGESNRSDNSATYRVLFLF
jgi:hypothetical protein